METPTEDERELPRRRTSAAARLTVDLLIEILSRLPVKSLLRFACVSRLWRDIISTDSFYCRNKLPPRMYGLFYVRESQRNSTFSVVPPDCNTSDNIVVVEDASTGLLFPFLPPQDGELWVLDCCNGLLLCVCIEPNSPTGNSFFVCNPATKTWDRIPRGRNEDLSFIKVLAFDPQVSPHYKVVTLAFTDDDDGVDWSLEMEILSSETGEWVMFKDCKDHLEDGFVAQAEVHVFFNGNIHVADEDNLMLMAVDVERRVYRKMELPHPIEGNVLGLRLAVATGHLRCSQLMYEHRIVVSDLTDYDREEWSLRYSVNLADVKLDKWPELHEPVVNYTLWLSANESFQDVCCGWYIYMQALHPDLDVIFLTIDDKLICYHLIRRDIVDVFTLRGYPSPVFYTYSPCYTSHLKQIYMKTNL